MLLAVVLLGSAKIATAVELGFSGMAQMDANSYLDQRGHLNENLRF